MNLWDSETFFQTYNAISRSITDDSLKIYHV